MMKLNRSALAQALDTFTDAQLSDSDAEELLVRLDGSKDLLCHILLETDFFSNYPDIKNVILGLSGPVYRSLLSSPNKAALNARMIRELRQELYEKQKQWAAKVIQLKDIENEIIGVKGKISALDSKPYSLPD
ncbi:hypothetical protein [Azospirillum largimobile]